MLQFTITPGTKPNAIEISFNEMPSEAVRTAIKSLKMRWNKAKHVWWGFVTEEAATQAITGAEAEAEQTATQTVEEISKEFFTAVNDGYMGAYQFEGSKSGKFLYGAELCKAIRHDLKRVGIKATARCKTYTGGQTLTVTVELTKADYVSEKEFIKQYSLYDEYHNTDWIYVPTTCENLSSHEVLYGDKYTDEQREALRIDLAKAEYEIYWTAGKKTSWGGTECPAVSPHQYGTTKFNVFTETAYKKLELAEKVIEAYHYDGSNAMVDYFDTNFYYDLVVKNVDREQDRP